MIQLVLFILTSAFGTRIHKMISFALNISEDEAAMFKEEELPPGLETTDNAATNTRMEDID